MSASDHRQAPRRCLDCRVPCGCILRAHGAPRRFVAAAVDAAVEWLGESAPVTSDRFETLAGAFAGEPGTRATATAAAKRRRHPPVKVVTRDQLETWQVRRNVAIATPGESVRFAGFFAVPAGTDGRVVPVVLAADGWFSDVRRELDNFRRATRLARDRLDEIAGRAADPREVGA